MISFCTLYGCVTYFAAYTDSGSVLSMSAQPKLHQIDHIEGSGKVVQVIETVAAKWERVATRLYIHHHIIERIRKDNQRQCDPCCRKIFCEWLDGKGRQPINWQTLITALIEADCSELAGDLQKLIPP